MKHRLIDILQCTCGGYPLALRNAKTIGMACFRTHHVAQPSLCGNYCSYHSRKIDSSDFKPNCLQCLNCEIDSGLLECPVCGSTYPVLHTVPRFVAGLSKKDYAVQRAFDAEWRMYEGTVYVNSLR